MTRDEFNAICRALPATTHTVQWGGSHIWKVGGKMFAVCGAQDGAPSFTFKAGDVAFEMLRTRPGLRPAPYLASRGLKWIQQHGSPGLGDDDLQDYIRQSYVIVALGLPEKRRIELGIAVR